MLNRNPVCFSNLLLALACATVAVLTPGCGSDATEEPASTTPTFPTTESCPSCVSTPFFITHIELPQTETDGTTGCNLDGSGGVDNQLGAILPVAVGAGVDVQQPVDDAIADGSFAVLLDVIADSLLDAGAGKAGVQGFQGLWAGTGAFDLQAALAGDGEFTMDPAGPQDAKLPGTISGGLSAFGPGAFPIGLPPIAGQARSLDFIGAQIHGRVTKDGIAQGRLCGALTRAEVEAEILPTLARLLNENLAAGGSTGQTICSNFDADASCTPGGDSNDCSAFSATALPPADCVTPEEVAANSIVQSVLKYDIVVDGQEALSLGVGFTAVSTKLQP